MLSEEGLLMSQYLKAYNPRVLASQRTSNASWNFHKLFLGPRLEFSLLFHRLRSGKHQKRLQALRKVCLYFYFTHLRPQHLQTTEDFRTSRLRILLEGILVARQYVIKRGARGGRGQQNAERGETPNVSVFKSLQSQSSRVSKDFEG